MTVAFVRKGVASIGGDTACSRDLTFVTSLVQMLSGYPRYNLGSVFIAEKDQLGVGISVESLRAT